MMNSCLVAGEQNMEPVEKEMKKTEKVEVTSVNVTDEQVTVKVDATNTTISHNRTIWTESNLCVTQ
ncbi:hypothetical protein WOC68_10275 [Staphylococcus aureus]